MKIFLLITTLFFGGALLFLINKDCVLTYEVAFIEVAQYEMLSSVNKIKKFDGDEFHHKKLMYYLTRVYLIDKEKAHRLYTKMHLSTYMDDPHKDYLLLDKGIQSDNFLFVKKELDDGDYLIRATVDQQVIDSFIVTSDLVVFFSDGMSYSRLADHLERNI